MSNVTLEAGELQQFTESWQELKQIGEAVHAEHDRVFKEYGDAVANDVGFSPPEQPATGVALTHLLEVIPGVALDQKMRATLVEPRAARASSESVRSLLLAGDGGSELGVVVSFDRSWGSREVDRIGVKLSRQSAGRVLDLELEYGLKGQLIQGKITLGDVGDGFSSHRGGLSFAGQGKITERDGVLEDVKQNVDVVGVISRLTSPDGLGQPIETKQILSPESNA